MTLGERIRKERRGRDWTQSQLADRIRTGSNKADAARVSRWEKSLAVPDPGQLASIANTFGWDLGASLRWAADAQSALRATA